MHNQAKSEHLKSEPIQTRLEKPSMLLRRVPPMDMHNLAGGKHECSAQHSYPKPTLAACKKS